MVLKREGEKGLKSIIFQERVTVYLIKTTILVLLIVSLLPSYQNMVSIKQMATEIQSGAYQVAIAAGEESVSLIPEVNKNLFPIYVI